MRTKLIGILISLLLIGSQYTSAAITTVDETFVTNDAFAADFTARLNSNFNKILTGGVNSINAANVVDDSLLEADMADEINPRIRTYEGASCEFVYTGLQPATDSDLTSDISAGTAYPRGYRVRKSAATSKTYTASKWTYVDIDINGDFQYSETAIGAATPSVASNSIRLARVSTDGTTIASVQDLRTTSCTSGPFSVIKDAAGEASLGDFMTYGSSGVLNGLNVITNDSTSVIIQPGFGRINGEFRNLDANLTPSISTTATPGTSVSGIDTGSVAASTTYYLYGVADESGVDNLTVVYSTSASSPSGATNYRRIGQVKTTSGSSLVTGDAAAISYLGKIRQIRRHSMRQVITGTGTIPVDDTVPQSTEGTEFFKVDDFVPTSARNMLRFQAEVHIANSSDTDLSCAVFVDSKAGAIASANFDSGATAAIQEQITLDAVLEAGVTTALDFALRCGGAAGTTTINGVGGTRVHGGALESYFQVTEYER